MESDHWIKWHEAYEDPDSYMSRRLAAVQRRLAEALSRLGPGPVRLISVCAGQGRDVIGVLKDHQRRRDVRALLVELDPVLAAQARDQATFHGLTGVVVRQGDASSTSTFAESVPADIVLVCGVFGNVSDVDIETTVATLPSLTAAGGTVIWTRHRRDPDLTPCIRGWFADAGFEEVAFDTEEGMLYGVGTHRLARAPEPYRAGTIMFTFKGDGSDAHR